MIEVLAGSPLSPTGGCSVDPICLPVQGLQSVAGGAAGSAARSITTDAAFSIFHDLVAGLLGDATATVTHMIGAVFHDADALPFTAAWFTGQLEAMAHVAGLVVLPLLVAASIGAVIRQDVGRLVRTWLVWLPLAAVLTGLMLPLVQAAVAVSDQMTVIVTGGAGVDPGAAARQLAPATLGVGGGFVTMLVGGVVLLGALVIWLEMVVRTSAIVITVFFLPLLLACLVWPATAHIVRRAIEVLVALILSKFVVAAVLSLGLSATAPGQGSRPDALIGVAILLLAAFAPMALLRLVPLVEAAAIGHLEGRARQPLRAAGDMAGRAHRQLPLMARMLGLDGAERAGGESGPAPGSGGDGGAPGSGADRSVVAGAGLRGTSVPQLAGVDLEEFGLAARGGAGDPPGEAAGAAGEPAGRPVDGSTSPVSPAAVPASWAAVAPASEDRP